MAIGGVRHPKRNSQTFLLPFENKKCLDMVLDEFELPKDYSLDFYRRQDIPLRLTITGRKGENRDSALPPKWR
jgi:hypothetical protein